ncbi:hypothetical protein ACQP1U_02755 [Actinomycetota bacterium]
MRLRPVLVAAIAGAALSSPTAALAAGSGQDKPGHYDFAVIGDIPYGADQIAAFPGWVDDINAGDPEFTVHVGDIKNGSTRCDDAYYRMIRAQFDRFEEALVYTPGDNEWTDCHRPNNGAYNPLERLAFDRSVFFTRPGMTLGQDPMKVASQANLGVPENVSWRKQRVSFAALHVVGSNDDLKPWTGIGETAPTAAQVAEQQARLDAALQLVRETFADASKRNDRAVVLMLQADMFDPSYTPTWSDISAFQPLVQLIVDESAVFDGEVYLFDGDSHTYNVDRPLAAGSAWLDTYRVSGSADNLTRVTVDGAANNTSWLRVTIGRPNAAQVLSWERVPYSQ